MQLAIAQLAENGAVIEETNSGFSIVHAGGTIGPLPRPRDETHTALINPVSTPRPAWAAQQYVKALVNLSFNAKAINSDDELTDVAKQRRLQPLREAAAKARDAIDVDFGNHKKSVEQLWVDRYALSKLTNGDVIKQLEGMEIRQRIPSLNNDERNALMRTLNEGAEEDAILLEAVLRGPFARVGALEQVARAGWQKLVDRRDPVGLEYLNFAKADIEWAERVIAITRHQLNKAIG